MKEEKEKYISKSGLMASLYLAVVLAIIIMVWGKIGATGLVLFIVTVAFVVNLDIWFEEK